MNHYQLAMNTLRFLVLAAVETYLKKLQRHYKTNTKTHSPPFLYLFFMRRTSRFLVTSSVAPWVGRAGDEAMTTPGAMVLAGAARIW